MNFFLSFVILAEIFSIAALSTNLLMGIIGIFSVAQAAIMGIGAYTVALLMMSGVPFFVALLAAIVLCAAVNVISSLPSLRLAGDYFIITSFGTQLVATAVFINWQGLTGGASGLFDIPLATIGGWTFATARQFVLLSTLCLVAVAGSFWLLMRSPYGRLLHAIRQDEIAAVAAGRRVLRAKVGVAAVSGAYAGIAGGLYATYISFIDPTSFDIHVSVLVVTMLVVGGARTLSGSIIGPFLLIAVPQLLAMIDLPSTLLGPMRQLVYGLILIAFMVWRPQGIAGRRL
ncbi:branched-chain amino acid ABC transporter permease [Chelatococcus asaccharovorans]|uniref:Amino acid/amide ABC transporter membrane protein 2 (HAAT family) n=1 Tax=Chelatococcus asaccharovorans TaxID=28210 RepID=A0A2V3TX11_9HYPH|nr:branched-chain amino acid ABC transporter permease [Chelatococcus asaccharovorans]MBS7707483.1 branched-chain amino acid ABC transporter permease [Chelatococcus asaccharovorans]PXW54197.1 amino acid/amide ABC transporter membrane protein 2 (HAAT family) [Chelatococcus asaccharovorans]